MQVMKSTLSSLAKRVQAKLHGLRSTTTTQPSSIRGSISSPSNPRLWSTHRPKRYRSTFVRPLPFEQVLDTIWEEPSVEVVASDSTLAIEDTHEQSSGSFYDSDDSSSSFISTPSKPPRNVAPMDTRAEASRKGRVVSPGIVDSRPIPMKSLTETSKLRGYGSASFIETPTKLKKKESSADLRQHAIVTNDRVNQTPEHPTNTRPCLGEGDNSIDLLRGADKPETLDADDIWADFSGFMNDVSNSPDGMEQAPALPTTPNLGTGPSSVDLLEYAVTPVSSRIGITNPESTTECIGRAVDYQDFLTHPLSSSPSKVGRRGLRTTRSRSPVKAGRATSPSKAFSRSLPTPGAKKASSAVESKHCSHFATKSDSSLQRPKKRLALKKSLTKLWTGFRGAQADLWGYSGLGDSFFVR